MLRNLRFSHMSAASLGLIAVLVLSAGLVGLHDRAVLYAEMRARISRQYQKTLAQVTSTVTANVAGILLKRRRLIRVEAQDAAVLRVRAAASIAERLYAAYKDQVPSSILESRILDAISASSTPDGVDFVQAKTGEQLFVSNTPLTASTGVSRLLPSDRSRASAEPTSTGTGLRVVDVGRESVFIASTFFTPFGWTIGAGVPTSRWGADDLTSVRQMSGFVHVPSPIKLELVRDQLLFAPTGPTSKAPAGIDVEEYPRYLAKTRALEVVAASQLTPIGALMPPAVGSYRTLSSYGLIIVASALPPDIRNAVEHQESLLTNGTTVSRRHFMSLIVIGFLLLAAVLIVYTTVTRSIRDFVTSFRSAARELRPIDTAAINYYEFKETASDFNEVVVQRMQVDEELRESKEKFLQAQKMEAVGRLAGGIAHDFNNILTVIMGYVDLAMMSPDVGDAGRALIQEAKDSSIKAAGLTRQLLAFSRRQELRPKVINPNSLILGMRRLLRPIIGEDVGLMIEADTDVGSFKADEGQIEQIIMNLVVNARDAMPLGGTITIRTRQRILEGSLFPNELPFEAGAYVEIEVSDTGTGMDEEMLDRIFEPFFTTKKEGEGTGLGLSTVYGIVKQSGGYLTVQSQPGAGSTFHLFFPQTEMMGEKNERKEHLEAPHGSNETILVIEDERAVRTMIADTLRGCNYRVLEASGGTEALEIIAQVDVRPIDLILSDVIMPDMPGDHIVEHLPPSLSATPVLYMTGYEGRRDLGDHVVIQKPFSPVLMATRIKELLTSQARVEERSYQEQ